MATIFIEPADRDVVVVRASRAPDGKRPQTQAVNYAVIEWGVFELVSGRLASLPKDDALFEARHCAAERGKDAWDSTGAQMVRLPRLPLVYRGVADTFAVSVDVTDYAIPRSVTTWKSSSHLSGAEALRVLVANGVPSAMAQGLLGKAPMPAACS
jgi:hypothetical protein